MSTGRLSKKEEERGHLFFPAALCLVATGWSSRWCLILLVMAYALGGSDAESCDPTSLKCGYNSATDTSPSSSLIGCSIFCCEDISKLETGNPSCLNDSTYSTWKKNLQQYQLNNCSLVCDDPCLDPLQGLTGSTRGGALNKALMACGVTNTSNFAGQACNETCCRSMADAYSACVNFSSSSKTKYDAFDALLTGYQLFKCPLGYTCYPNDKCVDPLGFINNNRGALNRALATCGVPDIQDFTSVDLNTIDIQLDQACSSSCCTALENAESFCTYNATGGKSPQYTAIKLAFPAWQALHCANFTCKPGQCFDFYGLINSNLGAANRVVRACGALSDLKSLFDNVKNWDPQKICRPLCCNAIEDAKPYCNKSDSASTFDTFVTIIQAFQAAYCNTSSTDPYGGPFMCRDNKQCWDKFGIINSRIGAATRAIHACGVPYSFDNAEELMSNQLSLNGTQACTQGCCDEVQRAYPLCNGSNAFETLDTVLTGYQLLHCDAGYTCIPDNKCFDELGLVNADRGFLNRALKACGVPDLKGILFNSDLISANLNLSCSETCCYALENAESHCNDSDSFTAFKKGLPLWQAKICDSFQCGPTECWSAVGLLNSKIGAANRVLRYCGAPSQLSDFPLLWEPELDLNLACSNKCCEVISEATPFCGGSKSFNNLVQIIVDTQKNSCDSHCTTSTPAGFSIFGLQTIPSIVVVAIFAAFGLIIVVISILVICCKLR